MSKNTDVGHAKNVASLEELLGYCTGFGANYNPIKAAIKLPALTVLLTNAQNSLANQKVAQTALDIATNSRELAFEPLKKLSTRVFNALASTDASPLTVENARTINFKLQGKRVKPLKDPKPPEPGQPEPEDKSISVSQLSYDYQVDNLARLIQTLTAEPLYKPNEVPLQVASLNLLLTTLKAKNTAVITATTQASNTRIARDKVLYTPVTRVYDIQQVVKGYVKSVFFATSDEYRQVSGIKFVDRH